MDSVDQGIRYVRAFQMNSDITAYRDPNIMHITVAAGIAILGYRQIWNELTVTFFLDSF